MIASVFVLALLGLLVSFYAYRLEKKLKTDQNYKATCDISDTISCSKPILSEYGEIFGFSNALLGMLFYSLMAILAFMNKINLLFYLSIASLIASAFLAYLLYFRIKTLCLICTTIYAINILLFLVIYSYR